MVRRMFKMVAVAVVGLVLSAPVAQAQPTDAEAGQAISYATLEGSIANYWHLQLADRIELINDEWEMWEATLDGGVFAMLSPGDQDTVSAKMVVAYNGIADAITARDTEYDRIDVGWTRVSLANADRQLGDFGSAISNAQLAAKVEPIPALPSGFFPVAQRNILTAQDGLDDVRTTLDEIIAILDPYINP